MPLALRDWESGWLFGLGAELYGWFTDQTAWRASCRRLADHLPQRTGRSLAVADLGCGPGVSAFEIVQGRPDVKVVGLDVARRMLGEARRRQRKAGPDARGIRWVHASAGMLPFRSESLDAVTGHSFLYLLPAGTRQRALAEVLRVLRPGGRAIFMEPSAHPATVRQVLRVSRDPRHLVSVSLWRPFSRLHARYTDDSLRGMLEGAGLVRAETEAVIGGLGVLAWAERPPG